MICVKCFRVLHLKPMRKDKLNFHALFFFVCLQTIVNSKEDDNSYIYICFSSLLNFLIIFWPYCLLHRNNKKKTLKATPEVQNTTIGRNSFLNSNIKTLWNGKYCIMLDLGKRLRLTEYTQISIGASVDRNLKHLNKFWNTPSDWSLFNPELLNNLVVECWLRVRDVPGSIRSQGPSHTKDVIKMVPVVPLFSTQHYKGKY